MKKIVLILAILFSFSSFASSNSDNEKISKIESKEVVYPDCWAAAEAAEVIGCGHVGCSFAMFDAVMSACLGL